MVVAAWVSAAAAAGSDGRSWLGAALHSVHGPAGVLLKYVTLSSSFPFGVVVGVKTPRCGRVPSQGNFGCCSKILAPVIG